MTFEEFMKWARVYLTEEKKIDNLGGQAQFHAQYELRSNSIEIRNSKNSIGRVNENDLQKIFDRYVKAPQSMKHRAVYYTDPEWPETPNRIYAPYIPAIIRYCIEEND